MPQRKQYRRGPRGLNQKQKKEVKKLVQAPMERKHFVTAYEGNASSSVHVITDLTGIAQGDAYNERDGDSIKIVGGYFRGSVVGSDATNIVRITLIRWKPTTTPTANDIYQSTGIGTVGSIYSEFDRDNRKSFTVLKDIFIHVDGYNPQKPFYIRIKNQPMLKYMGSSTNGANKLYLIHSSDSIASGHPSITMRGVLSYVDC